MRLTAIFTALALASALAAPAAAQDFSKGSKANTGWPLSAEQTKALFKAKVVDILCELSGDCPENCGEGRRQLGLLRAADNVLVLPAKNTQPIFTGAVIDLAPYCGQTVEVDGVLITAEEQTGAYYMVQRIKGPNDEKFRPTNRFSKVWIENNKDDKAVMSRPGRWFNKDERIVSRIEKEGRLGLGPEADAAFAKEWF